MDGGKITELTSIRVDSSDLDSDACFHSMLKFRDHEQRPKQESRRSQQELSRCFLLGVVPLSPASAGVGRAAGLGLAAIEGAVGMV
jgi:hypothetical protein